MSAGDGHGAANAPGRAESFAIVAAAHVVALAAGLAIATRWPTGPWTVLAANALATVAVFAFSAACRNSSVFDAYWSVAPPFFAAYWIAHATGALPLRQAVVLALVLAWAVRLTANWARGWPGLVHEDWRYLQLYEQVPAPWWAVSLLAIHLGPALQIFLGCLALIPALATGGAPWGALDGIALCATAGAILVETVADEQLRAFVAARRPGEILDRGLWAWSRHPNYFGELGFWCGLWLFGVAAEPASWAWTLAGPVALAAMFVFASIPLLDARSVARRPGYEEHMRRTSALLPRPPRRRD